MVEQYEAELMVSPLSIKSKSMTNFQLQKTVTINFYADFCVVSFFQWEGEGCW